VISGRGLNGSANFHHDIVQQILSTGIRCGMKNACLSLAETPTYRIREVDGQDDEIADTLADIHRLTFFNGASLPDFDWGHWWLAYHETHPVAFAGLVQSTRAHNAGYICRVGVLKKYCGNRLQVRLMRAMELRARHNGWNCLVSDTTDNPASANNFIRAGYRLYLPEYPWAYSNTLYWRKAIA
jgi:hypothetical protein